MIMIQTQCRTTISESGAEVCIPFDEQVISEELKPFPMKQIPDVQLVPNGYNPLAETIAKKKLEEAKARFQSSSVFLPFIR